MAYSRPNNRKSMPCIYKSSGVIAQFFQQICIKASVKLQHCILGPVSKNVYNFTFFLLRGVFLLLATICTILLHFNVNLLDYDGIRLVWVSEYSFWTSSFYSNIMCHCWTDSVPSTFNVHPFPLNIYHFGFANHVLVAPMSVAVVLHLMTSVCVSDPFML